MRRTMGLSIADGTTYAVMVGLGEAYFIADAVRLGASALVVGLVAALPLCIGSLGPVLALRLLRRVGARRPLVVAAALGQAACLLLLALTDGLGWASPTSLLGLVVLYQVTGQAAGTLWSSWMGDLVPAARRGSYFALRNRWAYFGTCVGLVAGGLLLHGLEEGEAGSAVGGGLGFALCLGIAGALRLVSAGLLLASVEAPFHGLANRVRMKRFLRSRRGRVAWRLVLLFAGLQAAVYVGAPYFQPFMLEELSFTYLEFMAATLTATLGKVPALSLWGRRIDERGARSVVGLAACLVALVPLPWLWANGLGLVVVAQFLSGISWAGLEVAQFAVLIENSYRRTRLEVFTALSVLLGFGQLAGTLLGSQVIALFGDLRASFVLSAGLRLVAAVFLVRLFTSLSRVRAEGPAPHAVTRILGMRATGLVHRPVLPLSSDSHYEPAPSVVATAPDSPRPEPAE